VSDVLDRLDRQVDRLLVECPPGATAPEAFWGSQFDLGLAWVHHPEGDGGLGIDAKWQAHVDARLRLAEASFDNRLFNLIGIGMGGATIATHGTPEQRARFLRPMFTGEEIWCQLFSEPGAGSDLAGLATMAARDGDTWVVNGQKVWTTLGHVARWGLLLVRTDPDEIKHKGLTYFVCDMRADGVEVRPLYQMTGEAEFNEVHLTDVHLSDDLRLGGIGQGWSVAMTTLMNERVAIGGRIDDRGQGLIGSAVRTWQERGGSAVDRDHLVRLWIEAEALRLTSIRASASRGSGEPGPEGSTMKLHWADLNKELTTFTLGLLGEDAMRYPGGYTMARPTSPELASKIAQTAFLRARANSIEGGTSEVMKTILGERVLGLPREPRADRDLPWREVPR